MKTLYFDCSSGASGDMIAASLLELLPDPDPFVHEFNHIGIQQTGHGSIELSAHAAKQCGLHGTHVHMHLMPSDAHTWTEECCDHDHEHEHHHDHDHDHDHDHHHEHEPHCDHEHDHHHDHEHDHHHDHVHGMTMDNIESILSTLPLSDNIRGNCLSIFQYIAEAEAHVHGCPVRQIHFHEVGQLDAVADVLAACMLIERLAPDQILASPVCTGKGFIHCAHGILPVPAPATARILLGIPCYQGQLEAEMCTPTGAAILKHFVQKFCDMPPMIPERIGFGFGTREFPDRPNMLRTFFGENIVKNQAVTTNNTESAAHFAELHVNVDDMTGEQIAFATERLLDEGALDVWTIPIIMKKSRPAQTIACLVPSVHTERFVHLMLQYTSSFGVRVFPCERPELERNIETVQTQYGPIRKKYSTNSTIKHQKWEYSDISGLAQKHEMSLSDFADKLKIQPK